MWLLNSPNLNPYDCSVQSSLKQKVFRGKKVQDVENLKNRLLDELEKFSTERYKWCNREIFAEIRKDDKKRWEEI